MRIRAFLLLSLLPKLHLDRKQTLLLRLHKRNVIICCQFLFKEFDWLISQVLNVIKEGVIKVECSINKLSLHQIVLKRHVAYIVPVGKAMKTEKNYSQILLQRKKQKKLKKKSMKVSCIFKVPSIKTCNLFLKMC